MNDALRRSAAHVFVDSLDDPQISPDDLHHLSRSLRLRDGEVVSLSDGRGRWRLAEWTTGTVQASGEITFQERDHAPCAVALVPVKGDRTDGAIEKLVEIGIDEIIVIAPTAHSVVRWDDKKWAVALDRYRRIARAAAMQSRRVYLPHVTGPVALDDVLRRDGTALAEPGGDDSWADVRCVVIGPEGGFSAEEVAGASRRVDLGGTVLRADTAAIVAGLHLLRHM